MRVICGVVAIWILRQAPVCRGRWVDAPPFLESRGNPGLAALRVTPGCRRNAERTAADIAFGRRNKRKGRLGACGVIIGRRYDWQAGLSGWKFVPKPRAEGSWNHTGLRIKCCSLLIDLRRSVPPSRRPERARPDARKVNGSTGEMASIRSRLSPFLMTVPSELKNRATSSTGPRNRSPGVGGKTRRHFF